MIPAQRHYSDPFVCLDNLLITESAVCFRRGSTSLVEMLRCRKHSLTKTMNLSACVCPSQDVASAKSKGNADYPSSNSAQNPSLLSPLLSPNRHFHHDSASHFSSPLLPPNLQPASEHRLSVPRSPQPHHHCRACMSLLLRDRTKGGGSLGHTHIRSLSASAQFTPVSEPDSPTSPHRASSPTVSLPPLLSSPSPPPSNSQTTLLTSPSHLSPPSQVTLPRSLYEGGDLTLLNHCLQHIVSRRTSSPSLSANHPVHSHGEVRGRTSSVAEHIDKRQSLDVPFFYRPNLDRNLLSSPYDSEGRPDLLVG